MNREYTVPNFTKSYNEETISFANLHYKEVDTTNLAKKLILMSDSILDKYSSVLNEYIQIMKLTDDEFRKYQYNPKVLSYKLYGTTELWFLLLQANQLHSTSQFNINPVKVYSPYILKIIESILNLERGSIDSNESDVTKLLNE